MREVPHVVRRVTVRKEDQLAHIATSYDEARFDSLTRILPYGATGDFASTVAAPFDGDETLDWGSSPTASASFIRLGAI